MEEAKKFLSTSAFTCQSAKLILEHLISLLIHYNSKHSNRERTKIKGLNSVHYHINLRYSLNRSKNQYWPYWWSSSVVSLSSTWLVPNDRSMRGMHYSFIAFTFSWRCGQQYVDQVASPFATCTLLLCAATELILYPGVWELLALISWTLQKVAAK